MHERQIYGGAVYRGEAVRIEEESSGGRVPEGWKYGEGYGRKEKTKRGG